jgi:hypothetical protein
MRLRAYSPHTRTLTPDETDDTARCMNAHWPGRTAVRMHVESNSQLVIEWSPGSGPVIEQRLPLAHLAEHTPPGAVSAPRAREHSTSYRQDRAGERWHIVPDNEHGWRGRALCGAPRQGTPLSETHAVAPPASPPEHVCPHCLARLNSVPRKDPRDVLVSTAV